jgi:RNA polymerase sigma-70 factor, ECF subfamily
MNEVDDAALVVQCLNNVGGAFEQLVLRYQRPVFNLALRMVHDYGDAQDISQVVFVKAYENLETYDSRHKFFSWLYRIAVNESLNVLKKRQTFSRAAKQWALDGERFVQPPSPDEGLAGKLRKALMALKPEQRAVVVLKHLADCSYRDLSSIFGISEKKVKSRLFEARKILREILANTRP